MYKFFCFCFCFLMKCFVHLVLSVGPQSVFNQVVFICDKVMMCLSGVLLSCSVVVYTSTINHNVILQRPQTGSNHPEEINQCDILSTRKCRSHWHIPETKNIRQHKSICDTFKLNMGLKEKSCYIGSSFIFTIS